MADQPVYVDSLFGGGQVLVNPWGVNALADDLAASSPWAYSEALKDGPPPRLFTGGTADLPAFTASGIDPALLMQLPATARHYVATLADRSQVAAIFEAAATDPHARYDSDGLRAAIARLRSWAIGTPSNPLDVIRAQTEQAATQAAQQEAINAAYATGGKAASDALLTKYRTQATAAQADTDRQLAAVMDALGAPGSKR